jgi:hypothetical protein
VNIQDGSVICGTNNCLGSSAAVTLSPGTTLYLNGFNQTVASLKTVTDATVDFKTAKLTTGTATTLAGSTRMSSNKGAAQPASQLAQTAGQLTYGGTLTVANTGLSLAPGDSFRLFVATTYAGNFSAINLPALPAGLAWDTSRLSVDGTISVPTITAAESWRLANFGTIVNTGNAADAADPDGDGMSNQLEYAFGATPGVSDAKSAQPTTVVSGDNLVLSYYQATAATDVTFIVEQSVDMTTWSPVAAVPTVIPAGSGLNLIQVAVPLAGRPSLMLRVRVTTP